MELDSTASLKRKNNEPEKDDESTDFPRWPAKRLKEYLGNRKISCTGKKKEELIRLCTSARDEKVPLYDDDDFYESRKLRLIYRGKTLTAPRLIKQWSQNLNLLPNFEWICIIQYLMSSEEWTTSRISAIRKEEGYVLFKNAHIHTLSVGTAGGYTYIKALCVRQTTITDPRKDYHLSLIFTSDGSVVTGFCDCPADDGRCKHIVAFLLRHGSLTPSRNS